jgi:plastocyanin
MTIWRARHWVLAGLMLCLCYLGGRQPIALAQDSSPQHYTVYVGYQGQGSIRLLSFFPTNLQVHPGDTVSWLFAAGLHNVRFTDEATWLPSLMPAEIDGVQRFIGNPDVMFPSANNTGVFTGEPINSGVQIGKSGVSFGADAPFAYSLSIEAEPGSYYYLCDIHPGMGATLEVVAADVAIPSPEEVIAASAAQIAEANAFATDFLYATETAHPAMTDGDVLEVLAGVETHHNGVHIAIDRFFPSTAVITAGQSVRWSVAEGNIVPHTVTAPYKGSNETTAFFEDSAGNPVLEFTPLILFPTLQDGGDWAAAADYNHVGLIAPGTDITVRFPDAGAFPYADLFEPGMTGTVVVIDK